jgi:hypothetical protein
LASASSRSKAGRYAQITDRGSLGAHRGLRRLVFGNRRIDRFLVAVIAAIFRILTRRRRSRRPLGRAVHFCEKLLQHVVEHRDAIHQLQLNRLIRIVPGALGRHDRRPG